MTAPKQLPQTLEEAIALVRSWSDSHCLNYFRGVSAHVKVAEQSGKSDEPLTRYFRQMLGIVRAELNRRAGIELSDYQISARALSDAELHAQLQKSDWCVRQARKRSNAAIEAEGNRLRTVIADEIQRRELLGGEAGTA